MNGRKAAREAAKQIEALEDYNRRASTEIKNLNACIDSVIAGTKTYCDWCEEESVCKLEAKGKGCEYWWLKLDLPELPEKGEGDGSAEIFSGSQGS